jgi:hypothetical protein
MAFSPKCFRVRLTMFEIIIINVLLQPIPICIQIRMDALTSKTGIYLELTFRNQRIWSVRTSF